MATNSKIQWTETTWNPVVGCTKVSEGCRNCYAMTTARRLAAMAEADLEAGRQPGRKAHYLNVVRYSSPEPGRDPRPLPQWNNKVVCVEDALTDPLGWRRPRRVFVNSMSDLFHEAVPFEFIAQVFAIMGLASWHEFQVLTKRPERAASILPTQEFADAVMEASEDWSGMADDAAGRFGYFDPLHRLTTDWRAQVHDELPLPNVWLGTSCENQQTADERIPHLLRCPAAVRFISAEPLLGPVDLLIDGECSDWACRECGSRDVDTEVRVGPDDVGTYYCRACEYMGCGEDADWRSLIHWVILGGESGPGARPCNIEWIRSIVQQCKAAGVSCFVKQLGARPFDSSRSDIYHDGELRHSNVPDDGEEATDARECLGTELVPAWLKLRDPKGGDISEFPEDLRVRQFPAVGEVAR